MKEHPEILFVEHTEAEVTDKPHCGDCFGFSEVTDKPHCGGCFGFSEVTDKPHCSDCLG